MPDPIPAVVPVPVVAPASPSQTPTEPDWLPGRLARQADATTRQILTELGVSDVADAKKALTAFKASQDATKSEEQKLRERLALLEPLEGTVQAQRTALREHATAALAALTEPQRVAVTELAGDDPANVLKAIRSLTKAGFVTATEAAKPLPAAASTTSHNAGTPPPAPANPTAPDHLAVLDGLMRWNPIKAAAYEAKFAREISSQRAKRTAAP